MTTAWPEDHLIRLERELSQVRKELEAKKRIFKTRKLKAVERQIADLKRLIELRKVPVPEGAPEISDYYES